jgi:hypothetical protein
LRKLGRESKERFYEKGLVVGVVVLVKTVLLSIDLTGVEAVARWRSASIDAFTST